MKTLSEIKRNIISVYSRIQDRVTDFGVGSVVHDLIFSVSAALEDIHRDVVRLEDQAYIATASGPYLDKLIDGTFQLKRKKATRSLGYVVFYSDSPVSNPDAVKIKYADFDYDKGDFVGGLQSATKVVGRNSQGDEGIVYAVISPRNRAVVKESSRLIDLNGRVVQYLVLPVASVLTGEQTHIDEGRLNSYPNPTPGIDRVINTSNPGLLFFSSGQNISSSPYYSRFTEVLSYNNGKLTVVNAFNFSPKGFVEISRDVGNYPIEAVYSNRPIGDPEGIVMTGGLVFEYIDADTGYLTINNGILGGGIPKIKTTTEGQVVELTLREFSYRGDEYSELTSADLLQDIHDFVQGTSGLVVNQRADQVSEELIFDPDSVVTADYRITAAEMVGGGTNKDSDEVYRQALRKYLSSLSRATPSALEAGALQVSGITFAKTLTSRNSPRGTAIVLISNEDGIISSTKRLEVAALLDREWKAAGVNVVVSTPELIRTHVSLVVKLQPGVSRQILHRQISSVVSSYLRTLNPGDSLKYADLLSLLREISGIQNVFNLLFTKELSQGTYTDRKAEYDFALMESASESYVEVEEVPEPDMAGGELVGWDDISGYFHTTDFEEAVGVIYYTAPGSYGIMLGDSEPQIAALHNMYEELMTLVNTPDAFKELALRNRSWIASDSLEYAYRASYLFSEPMEQLPTVPHPVNPNTIEYQFVRDYQALDTQLFRLDHLPVGGDEILPFVGINFIT